MGNTEFGRFFPSTQLFGTQFPLWWMCIPAKWLTSYDLGYLSGRVLTDNHMVVIHFLIEIRQYSPTLGFGIISVPLRVVHACNAREPSSFLCSFVNNPIVCW